MTVRILMLAAWAAGLAACGAVGGPEGGVANYDSLKQAQAACAAKGGNLVLQKGGDPQYIGDYECEGTK